MKIARNNMVVIFAVLGFYVLVDYILLKSWPALFITLLVAQLCMVLLAMTPVGESILRFVYGAKPMLERESEKLKPAFSPVYKQVKEQFPKTPPVRVYVEENTNVNMCALGTRTIIVTRGAIAMMSEEELKGMFAHEFGHLLRGDTMLPLVLMVGNVFMLAFLLLVKVVQTLLAFVTAHGDVLFLGRLLNLVITGVVSLVLFIVQALLMVNRRKNEFLADLFAMNLGYNNHLVQALYTLYEMKGEGKKGLIESIKSSHPNIRIRILYLEKTSPFLHKKNNKNWKKGKPLKKRLAMQ